MRGWFITDTALPMSWQSEATTTSSEAPASSARVAVCSEWTSWSTAKPSVMSSSEASMASTRSATRGWCSIVSTMMSCHCSAVDSSIRVNVMGTNHRTWVRLTRPAGRARRRRRRTGPGPPDRPGAGTGPAGQEAQRGAHGTQQLPQLGRRREVLVLVGDRDLLHALGGGQAGDHRLDQLLGGRRAGRHPDRAGQVVGQLLGPVDPQHPGAAGGPGQALEGHGVRRVGRADHHHRVGLGGDGLQGRLAVGGGEAQVAAPGHPQVGEPLPGGLEHVAPVVVAEGGLGQQGHRRAVGGRARASASTSSSRSSRRTDSGATAMVPTASSWPAWPTYRTV